MTRAGRAAKAGSRAGRMLKMSRLLRVLKLFRAFGRSEVTGSFSTLFLVVTCRSVHLVQSNSRATRMSRNGSTLYVGPSHRANRIFDAFDRLTVNCRVCTLIRFGTLAQPSGARQTGRARRTRGRQRRVGMRSRRNGKLPTRSAPGLANSPPTRPCSECSACCWSCRCSRRLLSTAPRLCTWPHCTGLTMLPPPPPPPPSSSRRQPLRLSSPFSRLRSAWPPPGLPQATANLASADRVHLLAPPALHC